jgi:Skp family chaperone for outer membrane proteins
MSLRGRCALALLAGALLLESRVLASGQEHAAAITIAVVDSDAAIEGVAQFRAVKLRAQQLHEAYNKEFAEMQAELTKLKTSLSAARQSLTKDDYVGKLQELQEKTMAYQKQVQEHEGQVIGMLREARASALDAVNKAVTEIEKERNIAVVLSRSAVVGSLTIPDLTKDVLERINNAR